MCFMCNETRYHHFDVSLQVFNPKLTGYSTGTGEFISNTARLNIAFPVAATEDALQQARILVQRIKNDPKINLRKHWKVMIFDNPFIIRLSVERNIETILS